MRNKSKSASRIEAEQFNLPLEGVKAIELLQALTPNLEEDILLALRLNYYVRTKPLVPDALYDQAERLFIDRFDARDDSPVMEPGSDNQEDYSDRVKALALYMALAQADKKSSS